jgi:hypothetical protein
MKSLAILNLVLAITSFASDSIGRAPSSIKHSIWETNEIPVGKACPSQAQRYDWIAYQMNGNGGYVCYQCDYTAQTPLLVVVEQVRCSNTITCKAGKCSH